jgi:gas vesicle protein
MSRKTSFLLVTTSFLGGLAAGLLLSLRKGEQNRAWLSENASQLTRRAKIQRRMAKQKSSRELQKLRNNIHQGIQKNIPDLYEATDTIPLNDSSIWDE